MAIANRYRGKDLVIQWIYPGGTIILTNDFTKFDVDRQIDLLDASASNTLDKEYINGLKDATAKLDLFDITTAAGTVLAAALVEGTAGTLIYGPQGTATGKPKAGFAAITKSLKHSLDIGNPVSLASEFQKTGAFLYDWGTTF
jgi:hypothetical protein